MNQLVLVLAFIKYINIRVFCRQKTRHWSDADNAEYRALRFIQADLRNRLNRLDSIIPPAKVA